MTKATDTTVLDHNVETDNIPVDMSASNVARVYKFEKSGNAPTTSLTTPSDTKGYNLTKVAILESPVNTTLVTKPVVLNSSKSTDFENMDSPDTTTTITTPSITKVPESIPIDTLETQVITVTINHTNPILTTESNNSHLDSFESPVTVTTTTKTSSSTVNTVTPIVTTTIITTNVVVTTTIVTDNINSTGKRKLRKLNIPEDPQIMTV